MTYNFPIANHNWKNKLSKKNYDFLIVIELCGVPNKVIVIFSIQKLL